jgi:hypothetical protein
MQLHFTTRTASAAHPSVIALPVTNPSIIRASGPYPKDHALRILRKLRRQSQIYAEEMKKLAKDLDPVPWATGDGNGPTPITEGGRSDGLHVKMSLTIIPFELLLMVADSLDDEKDICSLAEANRYLLECLIDYVFKRTQKSADDSDNSNTFPTLPWFTEAPSFLLGPRKTVVYAPLSVPVVLRQ